MTPRQTDKRERLIQTASALVYQHGFHQTTLAQIAQHAQVPLGTVYYFFKTKEALGEALIEYRLQENQGQCQQREQDPDPKARLESFVQIMLDNGEYLAQSGCPIGTLCSELSKEGGPLAEQASGLFEMVLTWLAAQFRLLGKEDEADDLALHLLSAVEGAAVLTQSFQSPDYFAREARRLKEWIAAL